MEIGGLPLHPLLVHAAVVLIPLTAALAAVFALLPQWRWLTRWPAAAMALLTVAIAWLAVLSGKALVEARPELEPLVQVHQQRGEILAWSTIPFAVLVLVACWWLPGTSALVSGRGVWTGRSDAVGKALTFLVPLAGLVTLVLTVLAGDSGARAVWG